MIKQHYSWWPYIKEIVRKYPDRCDSVLSGVAKSEQEAVKAAIEETDQMENGALRINMIRLVHFERKYQIAGAAMLTNCSERTANRWQRAFFERVARNRNLLD